MDNGSNNTPQCIAVFTFTLLYLSTFRGKSLYSWLAGDEVVIQSLSKLAKKNNLKFNILGRSSRFEDDEKKYYYNILRENYNYIPKSKFLNYIGNFLFKIGTKLKNLK